MARVPAATSNDAASNFFRLENIVDQYNLTSSIDLPLPVLAGISNWQHFPISTRTDGYDP